MEIHYEFSNIFVLFLLDLSWVWKSKLQHSDGISQYVTNSNASHFLVIIIPSFDHYVPRIISHINILGFCPWINTVKIYSVHIHMQYLRNQNHMPEKCENCSLLGYNLFSFQLSSIKHIIQNSKVLKNLRVQEYPGKRITKYAELEETHKIKQWNSRWVYNSEKGTGSTTAHQLMADMEEFFSICGNRVNLVSLPES